MSFADSVQITPGMKRVLNLCEKNKEKEEQEERKKRRKKKKKKKNNNSAAFRVEYLCVSIFVLNREGHGRWTNT